jgi:hypothetical protein
MAWTEATVPHLFICSFLSFFILFFISLNFFLYSLPHSLKLFLCFVLISFLITSYVHYFILCAFIPRPLYLISLFLISLFMFFCLSHTSLRVISVTCNSRNINFIGAVLWCGFQVFSYRHVVVSGYRYYCPTLPTAVERRWTELTSSGMNGNHQHTQRKKNRLCPTATASSSVQNN